MMNNSTWYNLDNQANVYPAVSNARNTNVFRLSCTLKQPIHQEILQHALDKTMLSFPYYQMIMRRGLFWFYLEPSDIRPRVIYEQSRPMKELFHIDKKDLLFQVSYYGTRINLEVFHALADGGGAIEFLRMLVYHYLLLAYGNDLGPHKIVMDRAVAPLSQTEDGFKRHYTLGEKESPKKKKAFTIGGTILPANGIQIIEAQLSSRALLDVCKSKNATLTTYLTALMMCGIYEEAMPRRLVHQDVSIMMPVDLRKMFPSQTFRNFFSVVDIRYNFKNSPPDFDSVLASVGEQFKEKISPDILAKSLNYNMAVQSNMFARMVPLFLKNQVLRFAYRQSESANTTVISNVGRVTMPSEMVPYIESFSSLANPTSFHRVKLLITSFQDTMVLSFISKIAETEIQRYFLRHLAAQGLDVVVTTNGGDFSEKMHSL